MKMESIGRLVEMLRDAENVIIIVDSNVIVGNDGSVTVAAK